MQHDRVLDVAIVGGGIAGVVHLHCYIAEKVLGLPKSY